MAEPKPGPLEAPPPEPPELTGAAGELEVAGGGGGELTCEGLRCSANFSSAPLAEGAGAAAGTGAADDEIGAGAADDETNGGGGGACEDEGVAAGAEAGDFAGVDEGAGVWVDANIFL